jgi:hypothetical protein
MKVSLVTFLFILFGFGSQAQMNVPSTEVQIKSALLAAPEAKRDGAAVYGYNKKGELMLLRKGTNELVCLADDPSKDGFSASCYHKDLEPFMARGRALKKEGKNTQEIFDTREQEVKSGKLKMPALPSSLFVFAASEDNFNRSTGEVKDGYLRYVIYIPYATSETTGLPLKPTGPAMPWIMHPGTHGAHIMINPPASESDKN